MNLDRREDVKVWVLLTCYSPTCILALNLYLCMVDWQVNVKQLLERETYNNFEEEEDLPMFS